MTRYIDAEPFEGMCIMKPITVAIEGAPNTKCGSYLVEQFAKIKYVDDIPTADVQEVKHGKWEEYSDELSTYCTVCGYVFGSLYSKGTRYCPNCGARMDGDEK